MKRIRHIITAVIWTLLSVYIVLSVLLHIPAIQTYTGNYVAKLLEDKFATRVKIGNINLGFLNRIIVDDFNMWDKSNQKMIKASRVSVSINILELTKGNICISSAQIFGLKANLYKKDGKSQANYQFVIDSLSSGKKQESKLDLRINSFIIRHGDIKYDRRDMPVQKSRISPYHIDITDISSHIIIKHITKDEANILVKKLSFKERSGLRLNSLTLALQATKSNAKISNFRIQLQNSIISSDSICATYKTHKDKLELNSICCKGNIKGKDISLPDFVFALPELANCPSRLYLSAGFSCENGIARINGLSLFSQDSALKLKVSGSFTPFNGFKTCNANISQLHIGNSFLSMVFKASKALNINIPSFLTKVKSIDMTGACATRKEKTTASAKIRTNIGDVIINADKTGSRLKADVRAEDLNLKEILSDSKFGLVNAAIKGNANISHNGISEAEIKGNVSDFEYNKYTYRNVSVDCSYKSKTISGSLEIQDPNCNLSLSGKFSKISNVPQTDITIEAKDFNPQQLNISRKWGDATFSMSAKVKAAGTEFPNINGTLQVHDFRMQSSTEDFSMAYLNANISGSHINIASDFGNIEIAGKYRFETLENSVLAILKKQIPTAPGIENSKVFSTDNRLSVRAELNDTRWLKAILGIPYITNAPVHIDADIDDTRNKINANVSMPDFTYNGEKFEDTKLNIRTSNDSILANCSTKKILSKGKDLQLGITASAKDNKISSAIELAYNSPLKIHGLIKSETEFYNDTENGKSASIRIMPSTLHVNDTIWNISPSSIIYSKNNIQVNHFAIGRNDQFIKLYGKATDREDDSLRVDLQNIDVNYILNLINFHSVTFDGKASGTAYLKSIKHNPKAWAELNIDDFKFQSGRMGRLQANVSWNPNDRQIDISAIADDTNNACTVINGYVSPARNYIDLGITAKNTNIEFLKSFCGSFMSDINARANGFVEIFGDLSEVNMKGLLTADGTIGISPLNTVYRLSNDTIRIVPDEIIFAGDTVTDRNGNIAVVTGALHHKHLTKLTYDISISADKFLCYDFSDYGNSSFYGTVYGTGSCDITGRAHNITFDINMTSDKGSFIEYNASSPDAITDSNFLKWNMHRDETANSGNAHSENDSHPNLNDASDMFINFNVATNPDFTLRVLMDKYTGDKISLNGNGTIKATYFNKGSFDMYGTYVIDHGAYNLTIQNIIKKDFHFQQGSNIVFNGNPFNSQLNLKAVYPVNGVSLADLKIGNSFSNNNVRVDCIMNIGGTPEAIKVDFDFDMPTVNNDAKQMVRALINSEEEMNQQVVYLLAIGRFYTDKKNNSKQEDAQQSQTSLAMQSLLSGTISQQVNNILGAVIKNNNWNFGTNISTGTEGFNNAEYEGLLSGSLFSNRLLINGQFGYRDNPNTTSSFIGDFDVKYLLTPSGSVAVKVYNQTNDRYFTKSSLNTQGLGVILKKDFKSWWDLFRRDKKKRKVKH